MNKTWKSYFHPIPLPRGNYSKFVGEPPETISICKYTYIQVDF